MYTCIHVLCTCTKSVVDCMYMYIHTCLRNLFMYPLMYIPTHNAITHTLFPSVPSFFLALPYLSPYAAFIPPPVSPSSSHHTIPLPHLSQYLIYIVCLICMYMHNVQLYSCRLILASVPGLPRTHCIVRVSMLSAHA